MTKRNNIIYWTATIILALFMFVGGLAQIFRQKDNVDGIIHLGYPLYFMTILGVWKVLGVITILLPRFPLVKEWAYAGFFFAMTGAVISHIASGDSFAHFIAPLIFAILTVVSWYFRPADRRL
ncbi:DoxX family protein [Chitinophaga silvisoli]|uniref:DoxX family protein n=1 Tax=Chitinophaga silvisoli TaxID=2291814 RepID=A0A3E1P7R5_9BACT|nr:DoxX family protein [Chitinophaga silvisoli]RFM36226.1 DoxX family protein [Chitinophaga silvisoli]